MQQHYDELLMEYHGVPRYMSRIFNTGTEHDGKLQFNKAVYSVGGRDEDEISAEVRITQPINNFPMYKVEMKKLRFRGLSRLIGRLYMLDGEQVTFSMVSMFVDYHSLMKWNQFRCLERCQRRWRERHYDPNRFVRYIITNRELWAEQNRTLNLQYTDAQHLLDSMLAFEGLEARARDWIRETDRKRAQAHEEILLINHDS